MNEIFEQAAERFESEKRLEDIKGALFRICYLDFENFAWTSGLSITKQINRIELLDEILRATELTTEYLKYAEERKGKTT